MIETPEVAWMFPIISIMPLRVETGSLRQQKWRTRPNFDLTFKTASSDDDGSRIKLRHLSNFRKTLFSEDESIMQYFNKLIFSDRYAEKVWKHSKKHRSNIQYKFFFASSKNGSQHHSSFSKMERMICHICWKKEAKWIIALISSFD